MNLKRLVGSGDRIILWLGVLVGNVLYVAARIFAPEEERTLSKNFGAAWGEYCKKVKIAWL